MKFSFEKCVLECNFIQTVFMTHLKIVYCLQPAKFNRINLYCSPLKFMIFMNVKIQSLHFEADSKLVTYVEKKLSKLTQYHERITKVDVFLKLDNVVHNIKDKIAEIKVHVPRHDFFVKHSSKSFEESFDIALDSVITQMKRKKEKMAA